MTNLEWAAFTILAALCVTVIWYARRARRAIDLADWVENLQEQVTKLQRMRKLDVGRLNAIDPPRAGTGANGDDRSPTGQPGPRTRGELYAAILKRQRGGG